MSHSLKLCLVALLNKPGVTVGRRGVRLISTLLAMAAALGLYTIIVLPESNPTCCDGVDHARYASRRPAFMLLVVSQLV